MELCFCIEACRIAENNRKDVRTRKLEDAKIWNERALIVVDFCDGLIQFCYYAFRKDDELLVLNLQCFFRFLIVSKLNVQKAYY